MQGRLTLTRVFYVSIAALVLLLGALFYLLLTRSQRSIIESAMNLRESASDRVARRVQEYLYQAEQAIDELEHAIRSGACRVLDPTHVESCLFAAALSRGNVAEVALTRATRIGFDPSGQARLGPDRWQVSVFRESPAPGARLCSRYTHVEGNGFAADLRCRSEAAALLAAPSLERRETHVADPTSHLTFRTPASASIAGAAIWTDLSYAEIDGSLPRAVQRVVVTVMKAIDDDRGSFAGILRVGLLASHLDQEIGGIRVNAADPDDPYRIFLCDDEGRLVARLSPEDHLETLGDDLRVVAAHLPPEIAAAVAQPALQHVARNGGRANGAFAFNGRPYFVSYRALEHSQGWNVGIVGPEDYYLKSLRETMRLLLGLTLGVCLLVIGGGVMTLRAIRGGLRQIARETERMRSFDFAASPTASPFRDVSSVLGGVERAKTAVRAMGKYVPIALVQQLFEANREPTLGGQLADVSIMFTDIKDFTTLAERLAPDELARWLGHYFEAMTGAVHGAGGTVDKYIGDSVMAIWNAPRPCPDHAERACRAALACTEATRRLFASPAWDGMPPLVTRFGVHRDRVMVGHFGAPDRMSYTAIGDGVNLASRLEGLNKQYGTTILVSEPIYDAVKARFTLRHIDRVAVKGRSSGVDVYELLGTSDQSAEVLIRARTYENALGAYMARNFREAIALLQGQLEDKPSRVLAQRCSVLLERPPGDEWNGVYVASDK
jgi:adenylate cyclase